MIAIGLLVVVAAVVAAVVAVTRTGRRAALPPVRTQLDGWVAAGLLDADQAAAIEAYEGAHARPATTAVAGPAAVAAPRPPGGAPFSAPPRSALSGMIEALGYLGGVLAVSGVVLLVAHYWDDLALAGQLALSGLTAAALAGAGVGVPERRDPAMARLRAFLWTLSTASTAVFAAVASRELLGARPTGPVVATTAAVVALTSGLMWQGRHRPVQQLVALAAAVVAAGVWVDEWLGEVAAGAAVWTVGAALVALGIRRVTTSPVLEVAVGGVAVAVGSLVAIGEDPGIGLLFVVASGAALVTLALLRGLVEDVASIVVLCVVGAITMLQALPPLIGTMAEDAAVLTGALFSTASLSVTAVGVRRLTRAPLVLEVLGAVGALIGCAVMAVDEPGVATLAGLATSLGLLGVSLLPGRVALSPIGAAGLLAFVPWTISWYFPGEGRVPLLISVSGLLIIALAVLMARSSHRFGAELGHQPPGAGSWRRRERSRRLL